MPLWHEFHARLGRPSQAFAAVGILANHLQMGLASRVSWVKWSQYGKDAISFKTADLGG